MISKGKKGSTGIQWDILAVSAIISIGMIFFYSPSYASAPDVGKFPTELSKSMESARDDNIAIGMMMDKLSKDAMAAMANNGIFGQATSCRKYLGYAVIAGADGKGCIENFNPQNIFSETFKEIFSKFKSSNQGNLDFSNVNYDILLSGNSNVIGKSKEKIPISIIDDKTHSAKIFIDPSFTSTLDYDFDEYKKIAANAENLFGLCKDVTDLEFCVDNNKKSFFTDNNFELLSSCDPEEKENFYKVVEYIESCSASQDNSCICTRNNPSVSGSFQISQEGSNAVISDKNNPELKEKIENVNLVDEYIYAGGASYVHKDQEGKVLISGYWDGKTCEPKPQTKFRFCVQSKNSKFYAYDENDKTTKSRPIVYKFALDFSSKAISGEADKVIESPKTGVSTGSADIKERIKQIANEIGFANIELALKLAKIESSFRHCMDGTLNCGTANPNNVNCNSFGSCGVMQVNNKPNAHEDLFIVGSKRLELFGCKKEETAYDLDCNIKSGLSILNQYYLAYGNNPERYNTQVDYYCRDVALNAKYESYTDPWDRALRAYNGFGCTVGADVAYVEKVDSAIV